MADYASQKVPELKKLLTDRGLPTTGNKPDLIARLQEDDQSKAAPAAAAEPKAGTNESSLEASAAANVHVDTNEAEVAAPAAPAEPAVAAAPAPAATAAAPAEAPAPDAAPKEAAPLFTLGLSSTAADDEARRRAARAKRFGIEEDEESKKRAERASRFGIDEKEIAGGLDSALPERGHKRGRGPRHEGDGNRPGKRQSLDRRGHDNRNNQNNRSNGAPKPKVAGILDDPAERAKAEARAARFAS